MKTALYLVFVIAALAFAEEQWPVSGNEAAKTTGSLASEGQRQLGLASEEGVNGLDEGEKGLAGGIGEVFGGLGRLGGGLAGGIGEVFGGLGRLGGGLAGGLGVALGGQVAPAGGSKSKWGKGVQKGMQAHKDALDTAMQGTKKAAGEIKKKIVEAMGTAKDKMEEKLDDLKDKHEIVNKHLKDHLEQLYTKWDQFKEDMCQKVQEVLKMLDSDWNEIKEEVHRKIKELLENILEKVKNGNSKLEDVDKVIHSAFEALAETIVNIAKIDISYREQIMNNIINVWTKFFKQANDTKPASGSAVEPNYSPYLNDHALAPEDNSNISDGLDSPAATSEISASLDASV